MLLPLLLSCKPPAFATHEADLMREPPPQLPVDAHAFWNDRSAGTYGELSVGPGLYRLRDRLCRTARITSIDDASHTSDDRTVLYCRTPDGAFRLDPTLSCRATGMNAGVTCRGPEGDDITLSPAGG